ncbi:Tetratricopeptide-like helical [Cynara cardunculus var. scolymus]|uniref:Tetratricopeptide-like helical n=1 Tax=Cynara cardunculus var. scolymus TaxID=59895 RepID=A0A103XP36_CYNCS|nr:Tetratricopeptide-like helical [Cynara cardunculus var. scolymus]
MEVNSRKKEDDEFHIIHKVPYGDGPYLVERDQEGAIVWFWKAINAGDRVESALKDMAVVMKQLDRTEEAIEAKCGKVDEQIGLLKQKLRMIYRGEAFNGRPTKTARSHGKKFQVSVKQETSRILGNLGWAYMQKSNFMAAEVVYKKAQMIDPDANKACNLGLCLMKQARYDEARSVLRNVVNRELPGAEDIRTINRARELLTEAEMWRPPAGLLPDLPGLDLDDDFVNGLEKLMNVWAPNRSKRLPIFEQIENFRDQLAC